MLRKPKLNSPPNLIDGSTIKPLPLPDADIDSMRQELEWEEKLSDIEDLDIVSDLYLLNDRNGFFSDAETIESGCLRNGSEGRKDTD